MSYPTPCRECGEKRERDYFDGNHDVPIIVCPGCGHMEEHCVFCEKIATGDYDSEYNDCVVFEPLNPVVPGHLLVVPKTHSRDASCNPIAAGKAVEVAGEIIRGFTFHGDPPWPQPQANIITSIGTSATQSIMHTHIHVVPRHDGDGLTLPWTGQKK